MAQRFGGETAGHNHNDLYEPMGHHHGDMDVGDMKMTAREADWGDWLICDGRAVSRTTYLDLFVVTGIKFGEGDGLTTFNLPDFRSRVPVGVGANPDAGLTARSVGQEVGAETHTLTIAELASHGHTGVTGAQSSDHTHVTTTGAENSTHTHTTTTGAESVSHAHPYVQPNAATAVFQAGTNRSGVANRTGAIDTGNRDTAHTHTGTSGPDNASHTHTGTSGGVSGGHTHAITAQGSNTPHNNMQPSLGVAFAIRWRIS